MCIDIPDISTDILKIDSSFISLIIFQTMPFNSPTSRMRVNKMQ